MFLTTFGAHAVTDNLILKLNAVDAANVDTHRREELKGAAARRGLGVAEHDADLLSQLVNEDACRVGLGQRAGELAERLTHQTSLQSDRGIADLSLDLGTRGQRGDGVDDDGIDGAGTHEHVNNLERLLTRIRLGNQYLVDIHANARGIRGIERGCSASDKCHHATHCLGFGQDLERSVVLPEDSGP